MTYLKGTFKALFLLALFAFSAQIAKADYAVWNKSADTFSINDVKIYDPFSFYELFNEYFGTTYTTSDAVLAERGFIVSNDWIALPGAQIYAAYKLAAYRHELNFISEAGQTFLMEPYPSNTTNQGYIQDLANGVNLGYEGIFSMVLDCFGGGVDNTVFGTGSTRGTDFIHMIAIDVTDLMIAKMFSEGKDTTDIVSAYFFAWEDGSGNWVDFDYQDLAYILVNVRHQGDNYLTPEPGTALIFAGLSVGLVAYPLRKRRGKRNG